MRRVIGTAWQYSVADVRLLTDVEVGGFRLNTIRRFLRRGAVRTLVGLHAKLYVADEFVLLTSANLTGTAFSRRYELGVILTGAAARAAIASFEALWRKGTAVREEQLPRPKGGAADPDATEVICRIRRGSILLAPTQWPATHMDGSHSLQHSTDQDPQFFGM